MAGGMGMKKDFAQSAKNSNVVQLAAQAKPNAEKRRKILENAARIFAKKGYERASLEEIAGKLKLTKASLYHYIKSKEEMLFLLKNLIL